MREDFLHYVWKNFKFKGNTLNTHQGELIEVLHLGTHNKLAGPDFFNAKLRIGGQLWAGNVEIHIKSSDWYLHGHENDVNYDNVILHVVWEYNVEVFRKDGSIISVLEIKDLVSPSLLNYYKQLLAKSGSRFINCENDISEIDDFLWENWLERLYIGRLEKRHLEIASLLKSNQNDWEKVLFILLMKNFGLNINGPKFFQFAQALPFSIVRKVSNQPMQLEALLFGGLGLLSKDSKDNYELRLLQEYTFLKQKFSLELNTGQKVDFFGLRPMNFPTVRLAQIAALYSQHQNLFSVLMRLRTIEELITLVKVKTNKYWDNHYNFGKESVYKKKTVSNSFIALLAINTLIPLKFSYQKSQGNPDVERLLKWVMELSEEKNSVTKGFKGLGKKVDNAMHSQAILELKKNYCDKNQCLQCAIGGKLLNRIK